MWLTLAGRLRCKGLRLVNPVEIIHEFSLLTIEKGGSNFGYLHPWFDKGFEVRLFDLPLPLTGIETSLLRSGNPMLFSYFELPLPLTGIETKLNKLNKLLRT